VCVDNKEKAVWWTRTASSAAYISVQNATSAHWNLSRCYNHLKAVRCFNLIESRHLSCDVTSFCHRLCVVLGRTHHKRSESRGGYNSAIKMSTVKLSWKLSLAGMRWDAEHRVMMKPWRRPTTYAAGEIQVHQLFFIFAKMSTGTNPHCFLFHFRWWLIDAVELLFFFL